MHHRVSEVEVKMVNRPPNLPKWGHPPTHSPVHYIAGFFSGWNLSILVWTQVHVGRVNFSRVHFFFWLQQWQQWRHIARCWLLQWQKISSLTGGQIDRIDQDVQIITRWLHDYHGDDSGANCDDDDSGVSLAHPPHQVALRASAGGGQWN